MSNNGVKLMEINKLFDITNQVVIVTGGNKGIGKQLASFLASVGAKVVLIARNKEELENVAHEIEVNSGKVLALPFDLTNVEGIPDITDKIVNHFGKIDALINNAGINITKPALEVTVEDWDRIMDINLRSVFFTCQSVGRHMIGRKKGKIINMSSQMAMVGYYKRSAYSSSKGGITQLTKALAIEWASHNINVNAIAPTFMKTPMTDKMFMDEDFKNDVMSRIPLGRLAKPEDLFGAVLYLCSESSNMVTGQTLMVDGGWTVW